MEGSEPDTTERPAIEPERGWFDGEEVELEAGREPTDEEVLPEPEGTERDTTDEWRIAPERAPATVAELEERIDAALVTAKSAEEAALEIGAAGVEAADEARRAAAMAEQASAAAARAASEAAAAAESSAASKAAVIDLAARPVAADAPPAPVGINAATPVEAPPSRPARADLTPRRPDPFEERVTAFRLRAEKVMIRLQKLEAGFKPGDGPSAVVRLR